MLLAESTRFLSLLLFFFFKALYQREFDDFMKAFFLLNSFRGGEPKGFSILFG